MFFRMVYKSGQIFLPFCHNTRVWRTDGQTEFSSQYRVCITCSAVKIVALLESVWNLLHNLYDTTQHTVDMLIHYLKKLKFQVFCRYSADMKDK